MNATDMGNVINALGQIEVFRENSGNGDLAASLALAGIAFWQGPKIYGMLRGMIGNLGSIDYGKTRACENAALFLLFGATIVPVAAMAFGWYSSRLAMKYPKGASDAVPLR